ncbi:Putative protein [Zobellia galactanivorans]|uniref:Uncharacterized protein n=1 Tax=Zobellia galactanivorans (strain DSM 12802 / CCUG 47099 / CIP 106680 / NCIMB 13871 / Dsij) TaxID=63186 RepID=G0L590_ZOBGA|nr:Putative protein [Zobellia galactanivorans]
MDFLFFMASMFGREVYPAIARSPIGGKEEMKKESLAKTGFRYCPCSFQLKKTLTCLRVMPYRSVCRIGIYNEGSLLFGVR